MSELVIKPGIYSIGSDIYHADPCELPSLSASIAKVIWNQTALHAWHQHPRLNPDFEYKDSGKFDAGSACHDVLLEGDTGKIQVIAANDWRTNAAKDARTQAYADGRIPLLTHQAATVFAMRDAALQFLARSELAFIMNDGTSEQTLISKYGDIWLRSRLDRLSSDRRVIMDYKTTGSSAHPEEFTKRMVFNLGYDIQAAMYHHQNAATGGPEDATYIWLVQEDTEPYACSLVGASPAILDHGDIKLGYAMDIWSQCQASGLYPGYPERVAYGEIPPWELARVQEVIEGEAT